MHLFSLSPLKHANLIPPNYIPEGGQNISTAKCDTNLRMTPFMYIYISIWGEAAAKILSKNFKPKF